VSIRGRRMRRTRRPKGLAFSTGEGEIPPPPSQTLQALKGDAMKTLGAWLIFLGGMGGMLTLDSRKPEEPPSPTCSLSIEKEEYTVWVPYKYIDPLTHPECGGGVVFTSKTARPIQTHINAAVVEGDEGKHIINVESLKGGGAMAVIVTIP
jgi:hypothetical protein